MMTVFADTLMIASRMDAFEATAVGARVPGRPTPWFARVRRWLAAGGR